MIALRARRLAPRLALHIAPRHVPARAPPPHPLAPLADRAPRVVARRVAEIPLRDQRATARRRPPLLLQPPRLGLDAVLLPDRLDLSDPRRATAGTATAAGVAVVAGLPDLLRRVRRRDLAVREQLRVALARSVEGRRERRSVGRAVHAADLGRLLVAVGADDLVGLFVVEADAGFFVAEAGLLAPAALLAETLLLALAGLFLLEAAADAAGDGGHLADDRLRAHQALRGLALGGGAAARVAVSVPLPHDTASPEVGRPRRTAQCCAVRSLASEDRALVVLPVALLEVEPAIFGNEEEPDARDHEAGADDAEDGKDGVGRDASWLDCAGAVDKARSGCVARDDGGD